MYPKLKGGNSDIFVIGCGQSLKKFKFERLKHLSTIAINGSFLDVPNPDIFLTADSDYAEHASKAGFYGINTYRVLVMNNDHKGFKHIEKYLSMWNHRIKPTRFDGEIGLSESDFATGQNSGFCGIQLATILGAKRIHLLGFDMCGTGRGNYHNRYNSNPTTWLEFFIHLKVALVRLQQFGITVVNHSPTSLLKDIIGYEAFDEQVTDNNIALYT